MAHHEDAAERLWAEHGWTLTGRQAAWLVLGFLLAAFVLGRVG